MGFFGGDDDDNDFGQQHANELADEQMEQNRQELEFKKQNLYATRLDIIKGQGGQSWVPDRSKRAANNSAGAGGAGGGRRYPLPWGGGTWGGSGF